MLKILIANFSRMQDDHYKYNCKTVYFNILNQLYLQHLKLVISTIPVLRGDVMLSAIYVRSLVPERLQLFEIRLTYMNYYENLDSDICKKSSDKPNQNILRTSLIDIEP